MKYGELSKPPIQSVPQPEYRPAGCFWSHGGTNFENQTYASKKRRSRDQLRERNWNLHPIRYPRGHLRCGCTKNWGEIAAGSAGKRRHGSPRGRFQPPARADGRDKTGELPQNELPASAAPSEATRSTTQTQQSASKAVAEADFAKTPSDIQKLIDQAKKELANASHDGKIISRQYDNSGATTVYGKVAVQNRTSEKMDIKKVLAEPVDLKIEDKNQAHYPHLPHAYNGKLSNAGYRLVYKKLPNPQQPSNPQYGARWG